MANDSDSIGGIPITAEQVGYAASEMIACGRCAKPNPPNRLNCFYCGDALALPDEVAAGLPFKPAAIETWEQGITLAVVDGLDRFDPQALSASLPIEAEFARSLSTLEPPVPLFRIKKEDADAVDARLSRAGLSVVRVEEGSPVAAKPPSRLKGIAFEGEHIKLHPFNSDEVIRVAADEVALIVVGAIVTTSAEATLKKKKKEIKEVDEYLSSSDHAIVDIYLAGDNIGFRILPHGFDFSCLGSAKSLLATDNLKLLIDKLSEASPGAIVDKSYSSKRAVLDTVWPPTVSNVSKGIERNWFGVRRSTGTLTSNEEQFTRYSRMSRKLL